MTTMSDLDAESAPTARSGSVTDAHGNAMTGDAAAVERYDTAIDHLLRFRVDVLDTVAELAEHHGDVPMTHVLIGHLSLSSTDPADLDDARAAIAALSTLRLNDRERAHAEALSAWAAGDWAGASHRLDDLLVRWPTDMLALQFGHQLDFFLGDAQNLRDRVGRSIGALEAGHPHDGFVSGMYSFGLEEWGTYDDAEEAGMAALAAHPDDVWAVHAVAHVHEMRGDVDRGIRFMAERIDDWSDGNLFTVHLWWHYALYLLEAGRVDEVLGIYDQRVHHAGSDGVPIEMLDASALLWRLRLAGIDTGDRFAALAPAWERIAQADPWYVFNDAHAAMAFCGADRLDDARRLLGRLDRSLDDPAATGTNRMMTETAGLGVARALLAHTESRHDDVVAELAPIRRQVHRFGGSHAQRDAVEQTLLDSAVRSGQLELAQALVRERLGRRPSSVFGWTMRSRIAVARGDHGDADAALATANGWRERFATV
jgi:tetratricopeptide (TPR) repeat protein